MGRAPGTIAGGVFSVVYMVVRHLLGLIVLLARTDASKEVELLIDRVGVRDLRLHPVVAGR